MQISLKNASSIEFPANNQFVVLMKKLRKCCKLEQDAMHKTVVCVCVCVGGGGSFDQRWLHFAILD
jgi:hypothetical protein